MEHEVYYMRRRNLGSYEHAEASVRFSTKLEGDIPRAFAEAKRHVAAALEIPAKDGDLAVRAAIAKAEEAAELKVEPATGIGAVKRAMKASQGEHTWADVRAGEALIKAAIEKPQLVEPAPAVDLAKERAKAARNEPLSERVYIDRNGEVQEKPIPTAEEVGQAMGRKFKELGEGDENHRAIVALVQSFGVPYYTALPAEKRLEFLAKLKELKA